MRLLIVDDEKVHADGLAKSLKKIFTDYSFEAYSDEKAILDAVENRFYSLAIVGIRMNRYKIDGI